MKLFPLFILTRAILVKIEYVPYTVVLNTCCDEGITQDLLGKEKKKQSQSHWDSFIIILFIMLLLYFHFLFFYSFILLSVFNNEVYGPCNCLARTLWLI